MIPRVRRTIHSDASDFPAWAAQFIEDGQRAEVLMVARNPQGRLWLHRKGEWRLPTGTLERGEGAKTCLVREVQEEFGVPLPIVAALGVLRIGVDTPGVRGVFTSYLFLLDGGDHKPRPVSEEGIDAWRLVTPDDLRLAAARLRTLTPASGPHGWRRPFWGAFRATEHEVVADLLASSRLVGVKAVFGFDDRVAQD